MPLQHIADYISSNEALFVYLGLFSALTFVATLVIIPWLIISIPADYFASDKRAPVPWKQQHPLIRALLLILKNLLGIVLLLLGILLLVLPGQGLLTVLIGIILLDFPGKFRFERWLAQRKPMLRAMNWIRQRRHLPPLQFD